MVRLRNKVTGAVMTVSESTASRLGGEWAPVVVEPVSEPEKAPARRTRKTAVTE